MRIRSYEDMNLQEIDVMKEIGSIGTSHAATALSRMINKDVRITIPHVSVQGYDETIALAGNAEDVFAATLVKMEGDVDGLMLFLFKPEFAQTLLKYVLGKDYNGFEDMGELEFSALTEMGNIIICSYVNAFSKLADMEIDLSVPGFAVDMLGGILSVPISAIAYASEKMLYFAADFVLEGRQMPAGLLMLPDIESLNRIMEKLGVS